MPCLLYLSTNIVHSFNGFSRTVCGMKQFQASDLQCLHAEEADSRHFILFGGVDAKKGYTFQ